MGALLRPARIGRRDFITANFALCATLLLMIETSAPVSIANANGPSPFIHPFTTRPAFLSLRKRIGRSEPFAASIRCKEKLWAVPTRGTAHVLRKVRVPRARASLALLTTSTSVD